MVRPSRRVRQFLPQRDLTAGTDNGSDGIDYPSGTYDTPALDELRDVNAPSPADGDALVWDDGAGEWVPGTAGGSTTAVVGPPELETHHGHLLTAHRGDIGSADSYPEVSLEAILQAVIKGADRVNIPMFRSSSGTFWGTHDGTLDRTTAQTGAFSSKSDAQLATYVFDAGYGYDAGRHGSSIHLASLDDFLTALRPYDAVVYWEVADTTGTLIADLAAEIVAAGEYWIERSLFLSFSTTQSAAIKAVDDRLPVYGLSGYVDPPTDDPDLSGWLFDSLLGFNSRADVTQYAPTVPVYLFEVDTEYGDDETATIREMYGYGVRDIFTNNLDAALVARAEYEQIRVDAEMLLPAGGTDGQVLAKQSGTDYDVAWETPAGGGDLDGLILVDPGTNSVDTGSPPGVTVTTKWGIDGSNLPYYDTANAVSGEEAALYWSPADARYVLIAYDF